jgi:hypothetical protein
VSSPEGVEIQYKASIELLPNEFFLAHHVHNVKMMDPFFLENKLSCHQFFILFFKG